MGAALCVSIDGCNDPEIHSGEKEEMKHDSEMKRRVKTRTVVHDALAPFFYLALPDQIPGWKLSLRRQSSMLA